MDPCNGGGDISTGKPDVLQFKAGVAASDVSLSRMASDTLNCHTPGTVHKVTRLVLRPKPCRGRVVAQGKPAREGNGAHRSLGA